MHGWDKALSKMHKGEVATLVCAPQYAFGDKGAPPKVPPNATVETELELVDWLDYEVAYNAKPGSRETRSERFARYRQEIADGTSPIQREAGKGDGRDSSARSDHARWARRFSRGVPDQTKRGKKRLVRGFLQTPETRGGASS